MFFSRKKQSFAELHHILKPADNVVLGFILLDKLVCEGVIKKWSEKWSEKRSEKPVFLKSHDAVRRYYSSLTRYDVCCWMVYFRLDILNYSKH
jgi:hypothetical protein